jgi:hypothetical protein
MLLNSIRLNETFLSIVRVEKLDGVVSVSHILDHSCISRILIICLAPAAISLLLRFEKESFCHDRTSERPFYHNIISCDSVRTPHICSLPTGHNGASFIDRLLPLLVYPVQDSGAEMHGKALPCQVFAKSMSRSVTWHCTPEQGRSAY